MTKNNLPIDDTDSPTTSPQRVVFFGTPALCVPYLEMLQAEPMAELVALVTNPDRPQGRRMQLTPTPVKEWAQTHYGADFPIFTPEKIKGNQDFLDSLRALQPDLFVVIAYGSILPTKLIDLPSLGTINVHYSLLSRYRGASPVEAALLSGDSETGVSIQQMVYQMDAGAVLAERVVAIDPDDTTLSLFAKLNPAGVELLAQTLPRIFAGSLEPRKQDESEATYCTKIDKADAELDLSASDEENYNKYRAYYLRPRVWFWADKDGKKIRTIITKATLKNGRFTPLRVIPAGKKEMDYNDFLRD